MPYLCAFDFEINKYADAFVVFVDVEDVIVFSLQKITCCNDIPIHQRWHVTTQNLANIQSHDIICGYVTDSNIRYPHD